MSKRYAPDEDDFEQAERYASLEATDPLRSFCYLERYGTPGGEVGVYFAVDGDARPFYVLTGKFTNLYPAWRYETTEEVVQAHADVSQELLNRQDDDRD